MADNHFALPHGYRLDEYEIRGVLGVGALGIKYVGFDQNLEKSVVIKEYLPDHLSARADTGVVPKSSAHKVDFDAGLNRFLDEGEALTRIAHPNLVEVHRCLRANGTGYIIRDYVEGEVLLELLERKVALSEEECQGLLFPILDGLEALHRSNFLHRDIGPDKIVIREDGAPVLLGFPEQQQVTAARKVFRARSRGSSFMLRPGYAALEQYSQMGHLGAWTDIYGLGAVMYRCATGLTPPEATERAVGDEMLPVSEATQTPYGASTLAGIDAALAIRAHERPQSVAAWRRSFAVASGQSPRGTRRGARGQMFTAPQPLDPSRTAGRARPARSPSARTATEPRRQWAVPAIAAIALIAVLTWVDTGILRSSDVKGEGTDTPLPLPTIPQQEPSSEPAQSASQPTTERTSEEPLQAASRSSTSASSDEPQPAPQEPPEELAPALADIDEKNHALPTLSTLVVETKPPGAEVLIAGAVVGQTPLEVPDLPAGTYDVTLRHGLYKTLSETITLPDPADPERVATRMERTLARATGALTVVTEPARAWIEQDGERLGERTPTTIRGLPAGPLKLTVGADAHQPLQVSANVPKNGVEVLELTLTSNVVYGTLTLELTPDDAEVTLPDLELAYEAGMRIPEGSHSARVSRDGYMTETRTVEVAGVTRSPISLTRNPQPFTVATTPAGAGVSFPDRDQAYSPGVMLTPGSYRVRAVLPGYETWEGTVNHDIRPTDHAVTLRSGIAEFDDPLGSGGTGPTMVAIPAGSFRMGCVSRVDCRSNELPVHAVTLATPFALSKFEVTCEDFGRFARATGRERAEETSCSAGPSDPAVNVSWDDATAYAEWLSSETRRPYRLPSEAEWEYAARAGTTTRYSWGSSVGVERANCSGCRSRANRDQLGTATVGSFSANPWGLHDMHGNAWEWMSDCRLDNYAGAAGDASARTAANCEQRVLRGGSWRVNPSLVRAAQRGWGDESLRLDDVGIRVVVEMQ